MTYVGRKRVEGLLDRRSSNSKVDQNRRNVDCGTCWKSQVVGSENVESERKEGEREVCDDDGAKNGSPSTTQKHIIKLQSPLESDNT